MTSDPNPTPHALQLFRYGLTETSPIVVVERYGPTEKTQGGMREIPGVAVLLCKPDASGKLVEVGDGEEGEICVVGPNVMMGYVYAHARARVCVCVTRVCLSVCVCV